MKNNITNEEQYCTLILTFHMKKQSNIAHRVGFVHHCSVLNGPIIK